jgi:hypothetical protein
MTESQTPEWIKKIRQDEDDRFARQLAEDTRQFVVRKTIEVYGPEFWKQLKKELQIAADNLENIGLKGSASDAPKMSESGEGFQVYVTGPSGSPRETYTNVFYNLAERSQIRCVPSHGEPYTLRFGLTEDNQLVISPTDRKGPPRMRASEAAQFIVEAIVQKAYGFLVRPSFRR